MATKNHNRSFQNLAAASAAGIDRGFGSPQTHGIGLWPKHRLIAHSDGLGWKHVYASLATEQPWQAALPAIEHHCVAYCVSKANSIERRFDGDLRSQSAVLGPRQIGTIPPGASSKWRVDGEADVLLIYLHKEMFTRVATEALEINPVDELRPILGETDALLEQLALAILSSLRSRAPENKLYVEAIGQMVAAHLIRNYSRNTSRPLVVGPSLTRPGLRRALELIEASLDQDLTLDSLAATANLSPFYFSRSFKEKVGVSPHQYLIRRRIERSKEMLRGFQDSLVEIALSVGFSSQSHFTSTFHRHVGVTPNEYRNAMVKGRLSKPT